ncbi:DUF2193 family protein, partial [Methanothrix sp.]|uniref:DUF2193 family protein n=1 Tax=Methanothrix sp. TaxID=90426 RepID=UPI003D11A279
MSDLYKKMVDEAMMAQRADVETVKRKRGQDFVVSDTKAYVDVVNKMKVADGQSKAVIKLHVDSVNAHYDILSSLTKTIRPEDDPFVEHYQTPARMEILYEEDEKFRKSVEAVIQAGGKAEALCGVEVVR